MFALWCTQVAEGVAVTEREQIVAWLRARAEKAEHPAAWLELVEATDLIEQGDHMKGTTDD